ncbi:hypothetical protein FRC03_007675 [Tulasnella sp. 419]|nr:hypothetical protein FRC03_007675 [Tulasnella sp. 419]
MVSIRSIVIATTTLCAAGVSAAHTFNLVNRCGYAVPLLLSNWGRTPYTGAAIGTLSAGQTKVIKPDVERVYIY